MNTAPLVHVARPNAPVKISDLMKAVEHPVSKIIFPVSADMKHNTPIKPQPATERLGKSFNIWEQTGVAA